MNNERIYFIAKSKAKTANEKANSEGRYYETFTAYLQAKNIRGKYIERYEAQTDRFNNWLQAAKEKPPETAAKKDILDYLQYLQEKLNHTGSTRQQALGILNHYYNFLQQSGQIIFNPARLIKLRGTKKKTLPKILSLQELEELLDNYYQIKVRHAEQGKTNSKGQFLSSKHIHQRNYLILSLCIYQGLKRSEWQALTLNDIDLQKATVKIPAQHKSNARTLPLQAVQIGILYEYLNTTRPLFPTENGLLINSQPELQKMMITVRKLYPKFTELQQLRASIITYWIQTEGLRKAQYKAGHRYISSTEEYLANDLESLQDDISKYYPL